MRITRREFNRLVRAAYRQLPPAMQDAMDNVAIVVEDWPSAEDMELVDGKGTLFGLYMGVPLPEREGAGPALPDRIAIFRQPIMASCSTRAEVKEEIRITLLHEIGHYLGMSEEDLHRVGYS
jgi:predicted Zn-dependent protease with MMP-like domain